MRAVHALFVLGIAGGPTTAYALDVPVAYVRCERTTEDLTLPGGTTLLGLDIYDVLPDVTNFFSGWNAPCDLVLREPDGSERILYDCSTDSTDAASCTAMDPAVSFDGETIAFAVFRGSLAPGSESFSADVGGDGSFVDLPSDRLQASEAQIVLVDVASGELTDLPHVPATYDAGPAWLPDGRLAFTSSRDGNRTTMVFGTNSPALGSRIWTVDPDGRNLDLASHHSLSQEQHPLVLADGRVAYSSWQIFGGITFRYTNGSPGGFGTIGNQFSIFVQSPDGAEPFAFYGQHCGDHSPITHGGVDHKAAHFLAQTTDGRVWFTDYYRGNNSGLGNLVGVMPEPHGQEGMLDPKAPLADLYAPHDIVSLATWSTSGDNFAGSMPAPELHVFGYDDAVVFAGKLGHAAALPDGGMAVVWGKGACGTVAGNEIFGQLGLPVPPATSGSGGGVAANVFTQLGLDTPACDAGIYEVTTSPSTHPGDLDVVVDSEEWHEIMPRAVVPYAAIHGIERPAAIPRADTLVSRSELSVGTPFGLLGAASILDRETKPVGGIHFAGEHQFHLQGTDTIEYDDDALCGVRILGVQPNRGDNTYQQIANVAGERVVILGEFGVRNREGGVALDDPSGNPDTSFLVRFPANVPYLMQGIDCDGRTLNTDQSWQSLRPGEMKTCGGCHVHSKDPRVEFSETFAALPEYTVIQLGEGIVPLLAGAGPDGPAVREVDGYGLAIDFVEDIAPIFAERCNSCHGGASPAGALALDRPGTEEGSTWYCLVADRGQSCVPEPQRMATQNGTAFRRPQLTRYLRAFNALGSPLYWKAAGMRTDGNTDATFDDASAPDDRDLDFGAAHATDITADELGLLGRWIDIGAPGGPQELTDTQRPTLTLAALHDDESVTALRVGTVDIPSGIDVDSLVVCIVDAAGTCTTMLAEGGAMPHDVLEIPLATPLSDHDVEVLARVRDVAGNETEVRRTVRWLLDSPLPPDPGGVDTGSEEGNGDGSGDATITASGASDAGTGDSDGGGGADDDSGGCGCTTGSPRGFAVWLVCVLLGMRRRRGGVRATVLVATVALACTNDGGAETDSDDTAPTGSSDAPTDGGTPSTVDETASSDPDDTAGVTGDPDSEDSGESGGGEIPALTVTFEIATPEQIAIHATVDEAIAPDASVTVRVRPAAGGEWIAAHPLLRIHPEWTNGEAPVAPVDAFAGSIFDLSPGTAYDVELTLALPGEPEQSATMEASTRALPPVAGAATITATPADDLQALFDGLAPGDVLELGAGTYAIEELYLDAAGTTDAPIVIRGTSRTDVILDDPTGHVLQLRGASHVILENLTLDGSGVDSGTDASSQGISFWDGAMQEDVTIRGLDIRGIDMGIVVWGPTRALTIYDNALSGNNEWTPTFLDSNLSWNDDGIRVPGEGNAVFENTLDGFGDSFAVTSGVHSSAVYFYRNRITMTADDAFEGDYSTRNIGFYDNYITNSATFVSLDPLYGGPLYAFRNVVINTFRGPFKLNNTNSGFLFYNNTIVRTEGSTGWGWVQFDNGELRNWSYRNNLLIYRGASGALMAVESSGCDPIDFTHNAFFPDGSIWWSHSGASYGTLTEAIAGVGQPPTVPVFGESTLRHEHDVVTESDPFESAVTLGADHLTLVTTTTPPTLAADTSPSHAGVPIANVTDGYTGAAPDIGAMIEGRAPPQWGAQR